MARLFGFLIFISSQLFSTSSFSLDVLDLNNGAAEVPCAADNIACLIAKMNRKPGTGGSGISTDKEIELLLRKDDINELGITRIPSEQLLLPKLKFQ